MTDNQEAVLAEALDREADVPWPSKQSHDYATRLLAAMPDYTLVRKDEIERLRAAVRAWVDYWDARTELWDAVGKCGHDPTADCPEMDAIRAQGTDDKYDHELRAALAATEGKRRTT